MLTGISFICFSSSPPTRARWEIKCFYFILTGKTSVQIYNGWLIVSMIAMAATAGGCKRFRQAPIVCRRWLLGQSLMAAGCVGGVRDA
jgi:hypothetical protein